MKSHLCTVDTAGDQATRANSAVQRRKRSGSNAGELSWKDLAVSLPLWVWDGDEERALLVMDLHIVCGEEVPKGLWKGGTDARSNPSPDAQKCRDSWKEDSRGLAAMSRRLLVYPGAGAGRAEGPACDGSQARSRSRLHHPACQTARWLW